MGEPNQILKRIFDVLTDRILGQTRSASRLFAAAEPIDHRRKHSSLLVHLNEVDIARDRLALLRATDGAPCNRHGRRPPLYCVCRRLLSHLTARTRVPAPTADS